MVLAVLGYRNLEKARVCYREGFENKEDSVDRPRFPKSEACPPVAEGRGGIVTREFYNLTLRIIGLRYKHEDN
jgi:hypothetical protein